MPERAAEIAGFLRAAGWDDAASTPVAGDLSARRFSRLTGPGGATAILMDAPRDGSTEAFAAMTEWLLRAELSAPEILAGRPEAGLMLLEDFGDAKVSGLLDRRSGPEIRNVCLDLLLHLRTRTSPALARPDPRTLAGWTGLADDWYPGADRAALGRFRSLLETILADLAKVGATVSLRDFHADNLIWLPDREGVRRLGLLDYQDAFLTHPVYDLVSFLTDARTDVPRALRQDMIAEYARRSGDDPAALGAAFATFSAQRNLRILGIFARAALRDGKAFHLPKMPRVYGYLAEALEHPVFSAVRADLLDGLPPPEGAAV